ncbi:2-phosphosulfolactate phosphatase [Neobacillus bataviensis]|uniref:2-phosphosulfolactate phosphatase n=1 Tax=Neobacillus bataviensis TaxID=220685 RepID=UPI001CBFB5DD|nr:2-phosphosulfolactate phosphatase [Neobacillus bataviensis]
MLQRQEIALAKSNTKYDACGSGRELRGRGFEDDVIHCSRLNAYQTVPILNNDHFIDFKEWGEINVYT